MKKYLILTSIILVLLASSCEEFLDVNKDPNNPTEVTPNLILPVAQKLTAAYVHGDRDLNHLGNMMVYNWSEAFGFSWYDDEFQYLVTSTFYGGLFNNAYLGALKQYAALDELGDEYDQYKAISKIMKAYHFQILVDLYGDIPYFDALKRGANPTPEYDNAKEIYEDLLKQLDDAIGMIDAADENIANIAPATDDIMFEGNMTKWKQFANTLKLRILVRAANSFDVAAEITKIETEGSGYITDDVAVQPGYLNEEDKQNPYWAELGWDVGGTARLSNDATCATQYVLDYLTTTNDPRIDKMYEKPATGHKGVDQGSEPNSPDYGAKFVSNIGPGHLKDAKMPSIIFTLAESYFNQAEAALNGKSGDDPEELYNNGVRASFEYLGLPASDADDYLELGTNNVTYASSVDPLEAIITQKWIALNGVDAIQSWFDYTRTGFPYNLPVSQLASTPDRPVRLAYPASESTGNTANVPTQPNVFTAKLFWAN